MFDIGCMANGLIPTVCCRLLLRHLARLLSFQRFTPCDFQNLCRHVSDVGRWKATGFRMFLLCTVPIFLTVVLLVAAWEHLPSLSFSICVFSHPLLYKKIYKFCRPHLNVFYGKICSFYGMSNMVYSVNGVIPLPSDVLHHGPLDAISCFPFESMISFLKYSICKPRSPAQQLYRRISEAVATECLPPSRTMDDCGTPIIAFADAQTPISLRACCYLEQRPITVQMFAAGPRPPSA